MRKRLTWAVFACGLTAGALLTSWFLLRDKPATPPTRAAPAGQEPPPPQPPQQPQAKATTFHVFLEELSPARKAKLANGAEASAAAARHVHPSGETMPYINLVLPRSEFRISMDAAADLVRLSDKLQGQKPPEAAEVKGGAWVYWVGTDLSNPDRRVMLWYDLHLQKWGWEGGDLPIELIDAVRAALKDAEGLAKVKPSAQF